jgi:hypothetical protein
MSTFVVNVNINEISFAFDLLRDNGSSDRHHDCPTFKNSSVIPSINQSFAAVQSEMEQKTCAAPSNRHPV